MNKKRCRIVIAGFTGMGCRKKTMLNDQTAIILKCEPSSSSLKIAKLVQYWREAKGTNNGWASKCYLLHRYFA
jgi:hypothetical protein